MASAAALSPFITRSHSSFWAPPASITHGGGVNIHVFANISRYLHSDPLGEIGPRDRSTGRSESFKGNTLRCVWHRYCSRRSGRKGSLFFRGLEAFKTGWLGAHMLTFLSSLDQRLWVSKASAVSLQKENRGATVHLVTFLYFWVQGLIKWSLR